MRFAWTDLQFVAGTVALDFANTVCYRQDPARRFDKISDARRSSCFRQGRANLLRRRPLRYGGPRRFPIGSCPDALPRSPRSHGRAVPPRRRRQGTGRGGTDDPPPAGVRRCFPADNSPRRERGIEIAGRPRPALALGSLPIRRPSCLLARTDAAEDLPELQLALHRPVEERQPRLVRHAHLRQPREGAAASGAIPLDEASRNR